MKENQMVLTIFSWTMLGLFIVALVAGILWGMKRGFKKSLFRFGLLAIAIILAFFLAPPIAGLFANINLFFLNDGYGNSMGLRDWIYYQADNTVDGSADLPQLLAFLSALPIALASMLVFLALFILFRFISWIFFAIFANKVVKGQRKVKRDERTANGMEKFEVRQTPKHRTLGALVGLITGFVIFLFFFSPVNGALGTMNQLATFEPSTETTRPVQMFNRDINPLASISEGLYGTNRDVQRSPYGLVSRFTGLQAMSTPLFDYLTTVRMRGFRNISLRRDLVRTSQVMTDFVAIYQNFFYEDNESRDAMEVLATLDDRYYELIETTIHNVFSLGITRLLTSSMNALIDFLYINFAEDINLFDEDSQDPEDYILALTEEDKDQEDTRTLNQRFTSSLFAFGRRLDHNAWRDTLIQGTRITRQLFQRIPLEDSATGATQSLDGSTNGDKTTKLSLFEGFQDVINNMTNLGSEELITASNDFAKILGDDPITSPLNNLFTELFEVPIFSTILTPENTDTHDLIILPLVYFLNLDESDLSFINFNWNGVAPVLTEVIITANNAILGLSQILNGAGDFLESIRDLDSEEALDALADLLELVTQGIPGISDEISNIVDGIIADSGFTLDDLDPEDPLYDIMYEILNDMTNVRWHEALNDIREIMNNRPSNESQSYLAA